MRDNYLLLSLVAAITASAASITWDPNTEPDIAGYRIYTGSFTRNYTNILTIPSGPNIRITNEIAINGIQFVAVTAFNTSGLEGDFSNEISITSRPSAPKSVRQVIEGTTWQLRTNKTTPVSYTPVAVVSTIPGADINATMSTSWWSVNKTARANSAGNASIVGRSVTNQSLITFNTIKAVVPIASIESVMLP